MLNRISKYLFRSPDELGFDNYLVLVFSSLCAIMGIIGTFVNLFLNLSIFTTVVTVSITLIFSVIYLISRIKGKYFISRYAIIIIGIILLTVQWFINYGSSGPIIYLFVVIQSFIIVFFTKKEKIFLSIIVFADVTVLFFIEYRYPALIGEYESNSARLFDIYTGLLVYLLLTIVLLNVAMKFYIRQKEDAQRADKLKSSFLANMSHEIRTPMNGILGFAEILKEPNLSGEEQQECINVIEKSGARMLSIINDIIDISRIESGLMKVDTKVFNLNELTSDLYKFFKPETDKKGIHLSIVNSLSSRESEIITDYEKLYAILSNLVKNAIKYTNNGTIEFGYTKKSAPPAYLHFFVKDTGIGIPKDRHDAIFERFIQADIHDQQAYQGAGLGLSISKAYIEMLKGSISVESEVEKGTTFYFTLPYTIPEQKAAAYKDKQEKDQVKAQNLKILIVEDDEASEILITNAVKNIAREILKVKTGRDTVETCMKHRDIDLILLDIQIPVMNGYEAATEIRKFNKDVIIIAQTAYALTGDRDKALLAGCNDYISKPINKVTLNSIIQQYFN
jgi:signal transduction histidine kinase